MVRGHRTAELRSIELHRLVAERLDDAMVARTRERVENWLARPHDPVHPAYAQRWLDVLSLPLDALRAKLVEHSQEMRDLRQSTPFAGAITHEEVRGIIDRVQ